MFRKLAVAFLAATTLASAAHAAEPRYFVDLGAGSARAQLGQPAGTGYRRNGSDVASALRVGVQWRGPVSWGLETGLIYLGKFSDSYNLPGATVQDQVQVSAGLLGATATWRADAPWYLTAHAGLLHGWLDVSSQVRPPIYVVSSSGVTAGNGWYAGVGGGYDLSDRFSVGVHYDFHHLNTSRNGVRMDGHVGTLMLQLEYRY